MSEEQIKRNIRLPNLESKPKNINCYYDKSWAVVIGINDYGGRHSPLANAKNDAEAFAKLLVERFCFDKENVIVLLDDQANRDIIMEWLKDNLRKVGKNDRVIFFFSGHGTTDTISRSGYIIPHNAERDKYSQYIDMEELRQACHIIPAKHIFIILDCCFSGVLALSAKADLSQPEQIDDGYLLKATEHKAWQILTAGADDELVADRGVISEHSPFTGALLDGLNGEADENKDHLITALELNNYIQARVSRETNKYGTKGQMPFFNYIAGSELGNFIFILPEYGKKNRSKNDARDSHSYGSNEITPLGYDQKIYEKSLEKYEILSQRLKYIDEYLRAKKNSLESQKQSNRFQIESMEISQQDKRFISFVKDSNEMRLRDIEDRIERLKYNYSDLRSSLVDLKNILGLYRISGDPVALSQFEEEIKKINKSSINPDLSSYMNHIGLDLDSRGKYEEAIQAYDEAIRLDPDFAYPWNNKGFSLNKLGKYNEAIQACEEAIRLDPNSAHAWKNKAVALDSLGKTVEANAATAKAKELGYTSQS